MAVMRVLVAVAVVTVSALAYLGRAHAPAEDVGVRAAPVPATALSCPLQVDRAGGGMLAVASARTGAVPVTAFAAGREAGTGTVEVDTGGGGMASFDQLISGGLAAGLVELGVEESAAAVVRSTDGGTAAMPCTRPLLDVGMIPGASTRSGEVTQLVLANPYAVDAVVSIPSASEAGIDSARELAEVIVPARTVLTRELSTLLPLRTSLAVTVRVERGAVHGAVAQAGGADRMLLPAVEPATEWWLPLPQIGDALATVEVATAMPAPVELEVTAHLAGGGVETSAATVPAEGLLEVPAAELGEEVVGVSVAAAAPVVVTVTSEGDGVRAGTPGVAELASRWLVPGVAVAEGGSLWILNPGEVDLDVVVQPLAANVVARRVTVRAGGRLEVPVEAVGSGVLVQATGEVAVLAAVDGPVGGDLLAGQAVNADAAGGEGDG